MKTKIFITSYHGWSIKDYKLAMSIYGIDVMISIKSGKLNSEWI